MLSKGTTRCAHPGNENSTISSMRSLTAQSNCSGWVGENTASIEQLGGDAIMCARPEASENCSLLVSWSSSGPQLEQFITRGRPHPLPPSHLRSWWMIQRADLIRREHDHNSIACFALRRVARATKRRALQKPGANAIGCAGHGIPRERGLGDVRAGVCQHILRQHRGDSHADAPSPICQTQTRQILGEPDQFGMRYDWGATLALPSLQLRSML